MQRLMFLETFHVQEQNKEIDMKPFKLVVTRTNGIKSEDSFDTHKPME